MREKKVKEDDITSSRKLEHIEVVLKEDVLGSSYNFLDDFHLVHQAIPEVDFKKIDTSTEVFGKRLSTPILISGMTGGHPETKKVNERLGIFAEKYKLALGVGSQRAAIEKKELVDTFRIARDMAPSIPILGNLGAPQFVENYGVREAIEAIDMVDADALAIHVNPSQEVVQPEGDTNFYGVVNKLEELEKEVKCPLIVKEVGAGFSRESAVLLRNIGIQWIDVGGLGGTSWTAVESKRRKSRERPPFAEVGETFRSWGIPTPVSVLEVGQKCQDMNIIATGGVRTGIEVIKLLRLGAKLAGIASPFLHAVMSEEYELQMERYIEKLTREIKSTLFLTGSNSLEELMEKPIVVTGRSREWLLARGYGSVLDSLANPKN